MYRQNRNVETAVKGRKGALKGRKAIIGPRSFRLRFDMPGFHSGTQTTS